ncbi:tigger transposable element-derived protein 1-like [Palaemon carinicauda]|uniref:tigger transposable element-derived protein 1-like n=1 Tax=Palaemon carinicauda TaxID=392227 RepID=UPI0035B5C743
MSAVCVEASSSNTKVANNSVKKFEKIVEDEGYVEQQGFNSDATGLFWKKMPSQTSITTEKKKMPGHKPLKDRLTLALSANASGDCKIKPLLVYYYKNPRAFKAHRVNKDMLIVFWRANYKAWVTRHFSDEWVNQVLGPAVKKYLQERNLPLTCLFCFDNVLAQPPGLEDDIINQFKFIRVLDFEGFGPEPEPVLAVEENIEEILSLGNYMGLEVDEDDITELIQEHHEELTTKELKKLHAMQNDEFQAQLSESEDIKEFKFGCNKRDVTTSSTRG